MSMPPRPHATTWPFLAWFFVASAGFWAPVAAVLYLAHKAGTPPLGSLLGLILAVALMGAGMIGAAAAGRFWIGVFLALTAGAILIFSAIALAIGTLLDPTTLALSLFIAGISFAARGALFAKSAAGRGWWIAVAVVAGEAAIVITAIADPNALPDWLLALLPAQWANLALSSALAGNSVFAAYATLIALSGTAAATLFVSALWPRRWTYIVMFSVWLSMSALVYFHPVPASAASGLTPSSTGSQAIG